MEKLEKSTLTEKACKDCKFISNGPVCPNCGSKNLSDDWSGLIVIIDPAVSEVAKMLEITKAGRYAIRVR